MNVLRTRLVISEGDRNNLIIQQTGERAGVWVRVEWRVKDLKQSKLYI